MFGGPVSHVGRSFKGVVDASKCAIKEIEEIASHARYEDSIRQMSAYCRLLDLISSDIVPAHYRIRNRETMLSSIYKPSKQSVKKAILALIKPEFEGQTSTVRMTKLETGYVSNDVLVGALRLLKPEGYVAVLEGGLGQVVLCKADAIEEDEAREIAGGSLNFVRYLKNVIMTGSGILKKGKRDGINEYYAHRADQLQNELIERSHNLRRLEAQRDELNSKVRKLREELQLLHESGSYVGEVIKPIDKRKVLVKIQPEGKYVVDVDRSIDVGKLTPNTRVALKSESYLLHKVLPSKVDPLVSLMMVEKVPDSTFDMIGGLDKQVKEIKEVIELPVKHPELFESLGIAQPKGVLLYGPPGTGKTLLARAVAHHTDCTFIRVSGSELVQKFIGEGSRMVRELFVMAREHAPSIIFMDEIDSIGSTRIESHSGGDSEVQRTMLELLNQLDGFEPKQNIKVIMATNRIDILDPALLRPGRIDRKIEFPVPNEAARAEILRIHSKRMNLTRGINLKKIAELMPGASGAEVKGVCTEAGMYALRERRVHVTQEDFELAVTKVMQRESDKNISLKKLWK
ncbi:hypothetical protein ACOME3_007316 [Neoechinorhynchus agilis]